MVEKVERMQSEIDRLKKGSLPSLYLPHRVLNWIYTGNTDLGFTYPEVACSAFDDTDVFLSPLYDFLYNFFFHLRIYLFGKSFFFRIMMLFQAIFQVQWRNSCYDYLILLLTMDLEKETSKRKISRLSLIQLSTFYVSWMLEALMIATRLVLSTRPIAVFA